MWVHLRNRNEPLYLQPSIGIELYVVPRNFASRGTYAVSKPSSANGVGMKIAVGVRTGEEETDPPRRTQVPHPLDSKPTSVK